MRDGALGIAPAPSNARAPGAFTLVLLFDPHLDPQKFAVPSRVQSGEVMGSRLVPETAIGASVLLCIRSAIPAALQVR